MTIEEHWQQYKSDLKAMGYTDVESYKRVFFSGAAVAITEIVPHMPTDQQFQDAKGKIAELVSEIHADIQLAEQEALDIPDFLRRQQ
jgi:hypothetical protein